MFSARDRSANAEHLGHVKGGYKSVFDKMKSEIESKRGEIRLGQAVTSVTVTKGDNILVETGDLTEAFDQVILTLSLIHI